jgi:UDP-N-acetylmuramoyl-tripeptide--D-alanyl-D-alanine ligase
LSGFRWTVDEVVRALGVEPRGAGGVDAFSAVSTDTRKVPEGALFVALAGAALRRARLPGRGRREGRAGGGGLPRPGGRAGARLLRRRRHAAGARRLGRHLRRAHGARVVAVAGSNGKTSTKELLRAALSSRLRVHATEANLNNQVGVPLTLLAAPDDAEALVVEVGTNEPGEVAIHAATVEPDAAVITSIGEEHLEGLGSLEGVLEEEVSILAGIRGGGPAFVADEPPELAARAREALGPARVRVAGFGPDADLRPDGGEEAMTLPPGREHGVALARGRRARPPSRPPQRPQRAAGAGGGGGVGGAPEDAARGIAAMPMPKMRNEWKRVGGIRVLADCYNANPPSVRAAVDLLASIPAEGEKVAVLGTMKEMGTHAAALHRELAADVAARVGAGDLPRGGDRRLRPGVRAAARAAGRAADGGRGPAGGVRGRCART